MSALIPTDALGRNLRHDGWTPDRQRAFLEAIAAGETVERACRLVQLSVASAYALKQRASGQSFALGWRAANLLGREAIADRMLTRALDGQVETVTRPDGSIYSRHKYDNRTALTLLTRLDRMAEQAPADADAAAQAQAARLVAQDWDAYLALLDADRGPAAAGLFLARRLPDPDGAPAMEPVLALARADAFVRTGAGLAEEVDTVDLDPARRGEWTAEQWARAEAAGLVRLAPLDEAEAAAIDPDTAPEPQHVQLVEEDLVWWDKTYGEWRTCFMPPPDATGLYESGTIVDRDYQRSLTEAERCVADRVGAIRDAHRAARNEDDRRAYFARLEAEIAAAEAADSACGVAQDRPEPASDASPGDRSDADPWMEPLTETWTSGQGRGDGHVRDEPSPRHAGLVPVSTLRLDADEAAGMENVQHDARWAPARGRGDEYVDDSRSPSLRDWPRFAETPGADPATLAESGVRLN